MQEPKFIEHTTKHVIVIVVTRRLCLLHGITILQVFTYLGAIDLFSTCKL
jgi:hypothetical protein